MYRISFQEVFSEKLFLSIQGADYEPKINITVLPSKENAGKRCK